ncbi:flagellar protein FlaG [Microbulbifer aggregans]|uniref:flagellar protein FlaG n=1 Tax=Microbulbifer aggregans TaxID=1769779 RepID=UPI001CFC9B81|nr:flagellar protein FlaG [Microbulbifer aggregans]
MASLIEKTVAQSVPSQFSYIAGRQRVEKALAQIAVSAKTENEVISHGDLLKPIERVNKVLRNYSVQFEISEDSGRTVIRLVDRENGELIRQIPPEEALNAAQRLEDIKGILLKLQA